MNNRFAFEMNTEELRKNVLRYMYPQDTIVSKTPKYIGCSFCHGIIYLIGKTNTYADVLDFVAYIIRNRLEYQYKFFENVSNKNLTKELFLLW